MGYSLDARIHSEVGLVRTNNQDSAYISPRLIVVADGMGGAAAGDLASAVAIEQLAQTDELNRSRHFNGEEMVEIFTGAISKANDSLEDLVAFDPALEGMGTTVCGAMFSGEQFALAHIGDSRGYLLRDGTFTRLTHDHSWVQSMVDEGQLTAEEAAVHPRRSLLMRVLNGSSNHKPDFDVFDAHLGDRLLFCSDGLSGLISDVHIEQIIRQDDLDVVTQSLANAARHAGGSDNITIVVADVVEHSPELDAREPRLAGAVTAVTIPDYHQAFAFDAPTVRTADPAPSTTDEPSEPSKLGEPDPHDPHDPYRPQSPAETLVLPTVPQSIPDDDVETSPHGFGSGSTSPDASAHTSSPISASLTDTHRGDEPSVDLSNQSADQPPEADSSTPSQPSHESEVPHQPLGDEASLTLSDDEIEKMRYRPHEAGLARRIIPVVVILVVIIGLAAGLVVGARHLLSKQFYIGQDNQRVAIYQGIPEQILGHPLGELRESSTIRLTDLPTFYAQRIEANELHYDSLEDARGEVFHLDQLAQHCIAQRLEREAATAPESTASTEEQSDPTPASPAISPSPLASATTSPLATASPTPLTDQDDLQDCR